MNEEMNYNGGTNKKKGNVIIVCLTMIILALIASATVVLLNNNNKDTKKDDKTNKETKQEENTKKEETKEDTYTKIDETKGYYYIEKGNSYTAYNEYNTEEKWNLTFSYPVINSKTASATKANDEIKEFVNKTEKQLISKDYAGGCNVLIINGKKRNVSRTFEIEHELYEINKLINIQLTEQIGNSCGSSGVGSIKSYFISKETGEVLNNEEIVKSFGYKSETLVNAYNSYLKDLKNRHKEDFDEYKSVSNINELKLAISENKKLSVIGPAYGNALTWYLEFDGAKLFVKDADSE